MDVWSVTVMILAETDSLTPDRDNVGLRRALAWDMVPVSVARLCQTHAHMAGQMADWCHNIAVRSPLTNNTVYRDHINQALLVFKDASNWTEASMWGKLVMTVK